MGEELRSHAIPANLPTSSVNEALKSSAQRLESVSRQGTAITLRAVRFEQLCLDSSCALAAQRSAA